MKKWSFLLLIIILTGCMVDIEEKLYPENNTDGSLTLTVQVPGVNTPQTYTTINETNENQINGISVLAFSEDSGVEYFRYRVTISGADIENAQDADLFGNKKTFTLYLKRFTEPVRLVVLANVNAQLDALEAADVLVDGLSKAELMEALTFQSNTWADLSTFPLGFPMWGESTTKVTVTGTDPVQFSETVNLMRSVARIDIGADINGETPLGNGRLFKINHVYLYRIQNKGRVIPVAPVVNNQVSSPSLYIGADLTPINLEYDYDGVATNNYGDCMYRGIYAPEAAAAVAGQESESFCIVVGATYRDGAETYYRVDFMDKNQNYIPVLRNHKYVFNIKRISDDGFLTPEDAANALNEAIEYDLSVIDADINDMVYNANYVLGVDKSQIDIDWSAGSLAKIKVFTTYGQGWKAEVMEGSDWLGINGVNTGVGNITGNLSFEAKADNTNKESRTGSVRLRAGNLYKDITIDQGGQEGQGANCYMVKPGEQVVLHASQCNVDSDFTGVERLSAGDVFTADVLWMDRPGLLNALPVVSGTGPKGKVIVTTTLLEGNALIAIRNSSNQIVWSFHVWVTDYDPESQSIDYNGYTFMDRNLGALSNVPGNDDTYGLLYQWGRKDPFPGATSSTAANSMNGRPIYQFDNQQTNFNSVLVTSSTDFEYSIKNPTTFYYTTNYSTGNWYSTYKDMTSVNNLWFDTSDNSYKGKGNFDPCPAGWRVPYHTSISATHFNGLNTTNGVWNNGYVWPAGYFPAAGGLMGDSGKYNYEINKAGNYWYAIAYGFFGYYFRFTTSKVENTNFLRTEGKSVRCVKE